MVEITFSVNIMNTGSYQLYILINKDISIKVGSLGICHFPKGEYVYTGSAMKNLQQRVDRHLRKNRLKDDTVLHWHIDYLSVNKNVIIDSYKIYQSKIREECVRNMRLLKSKKVMIPVKKFGSSDCKKCDSHLVMML